MSDRRTDQGGPLLPRRSLSGPSTGDSSDQTPSDDSSSARPGGSTLVGTAPTEAPEQDEERAATESSTTSPSSLLARGDGDKPDMPENDTKDTKPRKPAKTPRKPPRKARLRGVRLDPWSVMKMTFALSISLAIVWVVAVFIIWTVLDNAGVWESINTSVDTVVNADSGDGFDIRQWVGRDRVMSVTLLVSVANVFLLTALATLAAFVYNLAAALLGGLEVTLAEDR